MVVMLGPDGSWILLHGLGDGPSTAAGLADHLRAGGGSVLAPDLAHLVDAEGTMATIEHVATAVATAALASSWPGATWWLAGHSLGGLVAIELAERLEGVRGLALLEGSIRPADAEAVRRYAAPPPAGDGYGLLLPRAGGGVGRSRPEETARVLLQWIDRVTSPSAPD
jgi:pimeloyl-ACP methyl ester carboxylesterase